MLYPVQQFDEGCKWCNCRGGWHVRKRQREITYPVICPKCHGSGDDQLSRYLAAWADDGGATPAYSPASWLRSPAQSAKVSSAIKYDMLPYKE